VSSNRVTDNMLASKAEASMRNVRRKMIDNQEQSLTGKKINRPSDDPQGTMRAMGLRAAEQRQEQLKSNMELANSFLGMADSSLAELNEIINRGKELAIQMNSVTNSTADARMAVASEIEQLQAQVVQLGNSKVGDRYIFGGYITNRPPFDLDGNYFGDTGLIEVEAQEGQRMPVNLPGMLPFLGLEEVSNEFNGIRDSGARPEIPSVRSSVRSPASLAIENRDLDPEDQDDAEMIQTIKTKTGVNIFNVFKEFREGLMGNNPAQLHSALDGLDGAFKQVLASRAIVGARQNAVQANQELLDSLQINNQSLRSSIEDADTVKVFSDLARNETLLNSTLETNKKLLTPSLLDFLK
jgi:flagellar hook-associated protein 3 FlgL